jgi:hypothetical protein
MNTDLFALLERGFEELKNPIQDPGRLLFRDPSFLMQAVSDVVFNHLIILTLDPSRRKTLGPVHAEPIATCVFAHKWLCPLTPPPHTHKRFGSRVDTKMQINTLQMLLNGARADLERERNFLVRHSLLKPG